MAAGSMRGSEGSDEMNVNPNLRLEYQKDTN